MPLRRRPPSQRRSRRPRRRGSAAPRRPQSLGTVGAWSAYASRDKSGRVCYLVGQPQKSDSAGIARKAPIAMVTHRPAENIANVVSFVEGYPLKEGSEVALEIGDKKFELFTKDDGAWARTAELDRTIVSDPGARQERGRQGHSAKGRADDRRLFARRLRQGAGADRQGMRRQRVAKPPPPPSAPVDKRPRRRRSRRRRTQGRARKGARRPRTKGRSNLRRIQRRRTEFPGSAAPYIRHVSHTIESAAISSASAAPNSPRKWPRRAPSRSAPASCGIGSTIAASPISPP